MNHSTSYLDPYAHDGQDIEVNGSSELRNEAFDGKGVQALYGLILVSRSKQKADLPVFFEMKQQAFKTFGFRESRFGYCTFKRFMNK
jgi:hypothetical protein